MSKILKTKGLSKSYTDRLGYKINLFSDISIEISSANITSVLAPEGSGKTTLMKLLSGLEEVYSGTINSDFNKTIFIPSKPSSFPWLNVADNVRFNTDLDFESCQDIINKVGLHGYEEHFPHNESFGFRFRVSLARAIANNADLIILDEPFNHLNSITRLDLYKLIRNLHLNDNFTFFLGTSNISEAIFLSEKVYLLSSSPSELIDEIEIKLPQKRSSEIFESSEFIEIRSSIENILLKSSQDKFYNFSL